MTVQLEQAVPLVDLAPQHAEIAEEVREGFERVIRTGAFVLGPDVADFEAEFAAFCGTRHCVGVASGTDAIELALRAADIGPGDEVIVPANTFVATVGAIAHAGATPVLVDCDPQYLLLDPARIEERITERTKAIMPVHLYGQLAPVDAILEIADRHGLTVIEDGAQSQGALRFGRRSGAWGQVAATSFYPGKNLGAYGDAGAVTTSSSHLDNALREIRNHGGTGKYEHARVGFNSRLDTLQAVVLRAKLRRLNTWNQQRHEAAERYTELLQAVPDVVLPATMPGNVHVWHLYVVQVPERDRVLAELKAGGIGAGIHYPAPIHLLEPYTHLHVPGDFPVAEAAAERILSLPVYPGIAEEQQERVAYALSSALAAARGKK